MSNYTKSTNFATKDNLSPGDPLKIVRGTEIDTEFNNISTAISTKTDNSAAAITGGSITGITDLAIADGGTGASTATAALNNLLPSQTSNANKYLQTDGTNATWDAVSLSTSDITGTLPVANGGTGVTSSTGTGNVVLSNSPTLVTPALGTPASGVATNLTGLPLTTGVTGTLPVANGGTGVTTSTGTGNVVLSTSPTLVTPALGTPSALVGTNITGTASGLTAGNVTTNANLTGAVTSVGNASSLGSFTSAQLLGALTDETGTGSAVFATSPTLVTPILGTPTSATLTNATGLPIATGVSGLGTGVATFLATPSSANLRSALTDETGTGSAVFATSPTLVTPVLGTPTSATLTNATGLPLTTGVTGTLPTANGGTNLTSFTSGGVVYASSTSALATGSALTFDGTNLGAGGATTPSAPVDIQANSGATAIRIRGRVSANAGTLRYFANDNTTQKARIESNDTSFEINSIANLPITFLTNDTEGLRLTSTSLYTASGINVGFGTSSPTTKLTVYDATTPQVTFNNGTSTFIVGNNSGGNNKILYGTGAYPMIFYTNATEAARIDSSGNLLVGTTTPVFDASGRGLVTINGSSAAAVGFTASGADKGIILHTGTNMIMSNSVSGAITFQTTNTERARIPAAGGFQSKTTISVGDATPSLSGAGITFPAAQSASSDANTLDDYEEGTFTATVVAGGTFSSLNEGRYTKIGRQVFVMLNPPTTAITGQIEFSGLPFAASGARSGLVTATVPPTGVVYAPLFVDSTSIYINVTGAYSGGAVSTYFAAVYQTS